MRQRFWKFLWFINLITSIVLFDSLESQNLPKVTIGVVLDGPWIIDQGVLRIFQHEIVDLTKGEFNVQFPEEKIIMAKQTKESVREGLRQLLSDPEVDLVLAGGVIASQEAALWENIPKPVIAPAILNPDLQGIPHVDGKSGKKNLSYVHSPSRITREIEYFLEIIPFKKLVVLTSKSFADAIPHYMERSNKLAENIGVEIMNILVDKSAQEALDAIPDDAQAVFVGTMFQMPEEEFSKLAQGLIDKKLPSFALWGKMDVERGILAGLLPDTYLERLARRVALNVQRILLGQAPENIPVAFAAEEQLSINMATARAIGIYPSWAVVTEAELINPLIEEAERVLNLQNVVNEALQVNLDLAALQRFVSAGEKDITIARSSLLPQVDVSALGLVIDKDRAEASFGSQAEKTLSGSISASQVLFSEPLYANLSIQNKIQKSRELEYDQLSLDIVQIAATAYFNVLRTKTFERIQRENLRVSRENLELAEVRESVGFSGPAEVFRWQSQIASNRTGVIQANSLRNLAEIELNRILHRPLEEAFITEEEGLTNEKISERLNRVLVYMQNKRDFRIFRNFMVSEGIKNSPEIQRLDAAIDAQRRLLASRRNAFWTPTLALQGEISHIFKKYGAGSETESSGELPPDLGFQFPRMDETNWNVGLNLSFPLFRGTAKFAEHGQALEELMQLQVERKALAQRIEQRVRAALHTAGASLAAIQQSRLASEAALKNLDLVSDSYSRGATSIIDLIDAQTSALVAEETASNAVYDFLIDFLEVERAIASFDILCTPKEREEYYNRIDRYFEQQRVDQ